MRKPTKSASCLQSASWFVTVVMATALLSTADSASRLGSGGNDVRQLTTTITVPYVACDAKEREREEVFESCSKFVDCFTKFKSRFTGYRT